jgi:predicted RecB family nuclease
VQTNFFRASEFYSYYRPSKCELRFYLRRHGEPEASPGPYDLVLRRLGERHERAHLATLPDIVDLSGIPREQQELRTVEEVRRRATAIYQPAFRVPHVFDGIECLIIGSPDFLVREEGGYVLRDSKLARRVGLPPSPPDDRVTPDGGEHPEPPPGSLRVPRSAPHHPEILRQLEIYGWLYEKTFGAPPVRLEVLTGIGAIIGIPYDGGAAALQLVDRMLRVAADPIEPYSPVGWSKCGCCGYRERCWPRAEARADLALLSAVRQDLAAAFHRSGIETIPQLLAHFEEATLPRFSWIQRGRKRRIGDGAVRILREARALSTGKAALLRPPALPDVATYAIFDIEGLPAQLDELEKVYLWGIQVFGDSPPLFLPATGGFTEEGDRQGWEGFLANARSVFQTYGDVPFVHWGTYERTKLMTYLQRFGDPDGVAERVLHHLLDLCSVTKEALVLPLPSYSLKVVEKHVGFQRKLADYDGDRAMASYIEAVETGSWERREDLMSEILAYNREDLEATWVVLKWLKGKTGAVETSAG